MGETFKRLRSLAYAFYEGWKYSILNDYDQDLYERFVNEVAEPLNIEVARLLGEGIQNSVIDQIMREAKQNIWLCDSSKQLLKLHRGEPEWDYHKNNSKPINKMQKKAV